MFWFKALSPLIRLGIYAAIAAGLLGTATATYFGWRHHERMIGWNNAIEYVKTKNADAKKAADQTINEVDQCFTTGGSWNVSTGKCDH